MNSHKIPSTAWWVVVVLLTVPQGRNQKAMRYSVKFTTDPVLCQKVQM